ncbi:MAG TPA: hypothetical protein VLG28_16730 [Acidimicrobiia bacterium]|nr:hypothetical protein [Acidimicrobiia bacterium]
MTDDSATSELDRIVGSARRLGVEIDEVEALQWLTAVALARESADVIVDIDAGVFGHRVTMLDFSPEDLSYFRQVGELVGFEDEPDVETALALSGSAAQSKVQTYPGDCDYFERVNIKAETRDAACRRLGQLVRNKALAAREGDTYRLIEVKFGNYPYDVIRDDRLHRRGTPIAWTPTDVENRRFFAQDREGDTVEVSWDEACLDPGWCKLDWVVADPVRGQVANASNMLDVTWEAPDGSIVPLDGYLDPYFQEVYLEADSIPLFTKLVGNLSSDALDDYVAALEKEVHKYVANEPKNYGKAAKRMYNIFRLNGSYEEAAYLRELFDEPTAVLYQVGAIVRTLNEASQPGSGITTRTLLSQLDNLIISVVSTLDGEAEVEIVRHLLQLRASITNGAEGNDAAEQTAAVEAARARLTNIVNNFFYEKLTGLPSIASYMETAGRQAHR